MSAKKQSQAVSRGVSAYPLGAFHFRVDWGGTKIGFTEVTGLDQEVEMLEYREGSSPTYSKINMPGMVKYSDVVLKRGVFASDTEYWDWIKTIRLTKVERRDITVSILNEEHEPVMSWRIKNAWPKKVSGPILESEVNKVAIESLTVAHEGIKVID